jgi:hypothetical protein
MQQMMDLFAAAVLIAAGLATISIWAPRKLWIKVGAVALTMAFMPVAYAGFTGLLSKPKPVELEWFTRSMKEAQVLGAQLREGDSIYLWVQVPGDAEPKYYKIAWDQETAKQLQQAMREAEQNQGGLMMKLPYENSWDKDKPQFYALPQPKLPEKGGEEAPDKGPMIYNHPGRSA